MYLHYPTPQKETTTQLTVRAFEIRKVIFNSLTGGAIIIPRFRNIPEIDVGHDYVAREKPCAGGFFVIDENEVYRFFTRRTFLKYFTQWFE